MAAQKFGIVLRWEAKAFFCCLFFLIVFTESHAALNNTVLVTNPVSMITLNINEISSLYSIETLTSLSPDQCRIWSDTGSTPPLTWLVEGRLLLFSVTNLYEIYDVTSVSNSFAQLKYSPTYLSFNRIGLADSTGLSFYLSLNATPVCGSTALPTKILCNEGIAVPINRNTSASSTGTTSTLSQTMCGQRYAFSYRYSYGCANDIFFPPSCKTTCVQTRNSTHCYTCDAHDGARVCCSGTSQPDCRNAGSDPALPVPVESTPTGAVVALVCLSLLTVFLFILAIVMTRLLLSERHKRPHLITPLDTYNGGWASNDRQAKRRGNSFRVESVTPPTPESLHDQPVFVINEHRKLSENDYGGATTVSVAAAPLPRWSSQKTRAEYHDTPAVETIPKRRPSSDELYGSLGRQRQKMNGNAHRVGTQSTAESRPAMLNGFGSKPAKKREEKEDADDLGTLF